MFGLQGMSVLLVMGSLIFLLCELVQGEPNLGREDCTGVFTGRTIRLEYLYYKSYWLKGSTRSPIYNVFGYQMGRQLYAHWSQKHEIFDHKKGFSWRLHDCGSDYVCFENMAVHSDWLKTKSGSLYMETNYLSDIDRDANDEFKFKIYCDSCQLHNRCQIITKSREGLYLNRWKKLANRWYPESYTSSWYDWDIVLLVPMEQWKTVETSYCNNGPSATGVHYRSSVKVGISQKVAETVGISKEMSFSLQSSPLTWLYSNKATHAHSWTNEQFTALEQDTEITIRGPRGTDGITVPPGKKSVLKQLIGYYGEPGNLQTGFWMKSNELSTTLIDC